jgi:hypothetical protein
MALKDSRLTAGDQDSLEIDPPEPCSLLEYSLCYEASLSAGFYPTVQIN